MRGTNFGYEVPFIHRQLQVCQWQFSIMTPADSALARTVCHSGEQFPKSLSSHTAYPDIVWVTVENADIVLFFCAFTHEWRLRGICSYHTCQGSHRQAGGSKLHLFYVFSGPREKNGMILWLRHVSLSACLLGWYTGISSHMQDSDDKCGS